MTAAIVNIEIIAQLTKSSHCLRSRHFGNTVTVKVTVKLIFALGNMQIRGPDTPNHKDYSIEFAMIKNYENDTKFAFLLHLVQTSPKLLSDRGQY